MLQFYYEGNYQCSEYLCKHKTRQLTIGDRCIGESCKRKGKVVAEYSEQQINDTLRYLDGLFNVEKHFHEVKSKGPIVSKDAASYEQKIPMKNLQDTVGTVLARSNYNNVNMADLFAFMNK
mmetsp:Transcript_28124/g.27115  ORF Transcript_28124/g.27115 Transcript_28124/m.27115 type:complete len:121 (+) Transcript_28124:1500-1862(+)